MASTTRFKFFQDGFRLFTGRMLNDGLKWASGSPIILALSDETTNLTVAANVIKFRLPTLVLDSVPRISLGTASSNGPVTVDIFSNGVSILAAPLSLAAGATTSLGTGALRAPEMIIPNDAQITSDITAAGTGAKGLKLMLLCRRYAP